MHNTFQVLCLTVFAVAVLSGCANLNVKRMTYNALRQHDCRINQPMSNCNGSYNSEFSEYERLREEYMREQQRARLLLGGNQRVLIVPDASFSNTVIR